MSDQGGGLQKSSSATNRHAQVGACASFSYVDGVLSNQASLAARSYSDIGPNYNNNLGSQYIGGADGINNNNSNNIMDIVAHQQYNHYNVTEVQGSAPYYFPCSYVAGKPGVGSWSLRVDPEVKRKRRLASYRAISFEGKMKSSMSKSFKWFKHKCFSLLSGHAGGPPPP